MKNNEIYEYIIQNKEIFDNIIEFLENNVEDDLENINTIKFISQKIDNNDKLIELLQMISISTEMKYCLKKHITLLNILKIKSSKHYQMLTYEI